MKIISLSKSKINDQIVKLRKSQEEDFKIVDKSVENIINDVRKYGDKSLYKFTNEFDQIKLKSLILDTNLINRSDNQLSNKLKLSIKNSIKRVSFYQKKKLTKSYQFKDSLGNKLGWIVTPLQRVGVYVPGGTAAYPSSLIMTASLARTAGVKDVIVFTPPSENGINPAILYVCKLLNIKEVYNVGGAQAIAAMAYGTKTIKKVNKIVGPGNIYIASAKRKVFGQVGIDMVAGPSEVLIIADSTANPSVLSRDLLAQAEHDVNASSILLTTSKNLAKQVKSKVDQDTSLSKRKNIVEKSLKKNGKIFILPSIDACIEFTNLYAPEHLQIVIKSPDKIIKKINNAGSIFLGINSAEAFGDYIAGPSHVLPTSGNATFSSPLSSLDFIKYSSLTSISKKGLKKLSSQVQELAESEGLYEHSNSIKVRNNNEN